MLWGSSVSIGYGLDDLGSIPVEGGNGFFSLRLRVQTGSGTPVGTETLSLKLKYLDLEDDNSFLCSAKTKNDTFTPAYAFMEWWLINYGDFTLLYVYLKI
jgi:hypothetical protein